MKSRAQEMAERLQGWAPGGVVAHKMTPGEKMRRVVELRYLHGMTLEEVGQLLGVTRERVRQIEAKAIRILRSKRDNRMKAQDALAGVNEVL